MRALGSSPTARVDTSSEIAAPSRESVNAFHAAALDAEGLGAGLPWLRPNYGLTYCAAFVIDFDGYKLEVHHQ